MHHLSKAVLPATLFLALTTVTLRAETRDDTYATPSGAIRGVVFSGIEVMTGSHAELLGVAVPFNGDLRRDGFLLRVMGSRVDYDMDPGHGLGWQGEVMVGYGFSKGQLSGSVFLGGDYQDYKLSPDDPTAIVRGPEWGIKTTANVQTNRELPYYLELNGSYSTSFQSYFAQARVGVNQFGLTFGPEVAWLGSEGYDARRVGGFVYFELQDRPVAITLAAGHNFLLGSGTTVSGTSPSSGPYFNFNIAVGF